MPTLYQKRRGVRIKWKWSKALSILFTATFYLLSSRTFAATPSETTKPKLYMVTPSDHTITSPADFPVWAELYNVKKAYLYYRSNSEQDFYREEMKPFDWDPTIYGATIPARMLEAGYVEYYVEIEGLNGEDIKGPLQNARVVKPESYDDAPNMITDQYCDDIDSNNGKRIDGTTISTQYLINIRTAVIPLILDFVRGGIPHLIAKVFFLNGMKFQN